jgi:hypothetical protein
VWLSSEIALAGRAQIGKNIFLPAKLHSSRERIASGGGSAVDSAAPISVAPLFAPPWVELHDLSPSHKAGHERSRRKQAAAISASTVGIERGQGHRAKCVDKHAGPRMLLPWLPSVVGIADLGPEPPGQTLRAGLHEEVVVPGKYGPSQGSQEVHPRLPRRNAPR